MRFSIYIGKRIFCIIKPQKFINPKKNRPFPNRESPPKMILPFPDLGMGHGNPIR